MTESRVSIAAWIDASFLNGHTCVSREAIRTGDHFKIARKIGVVRVHSDDVVLPDIVPQAGAPGDAQHTKTSPPAHPCLRRPRTRLDSEVIAVGYFYVSVESKLLMSAHDSRCQG